MTAPFWGPTLDCPDPLALASFYQLVAGGELAVVTDSFVEPSPDTFRVFLDPAGHPFCLTTWRTPSGPPESR